MRFRDMRALGIPTKRSKSQHQRFRRRLDRTLREMREDQLEDRVSLIQFGREIKLTHVPDSRADPFLMVVVGGRETLIYPETI